MRNISPEKLIENALKEILQEKSSTISRPIFSLFSKDTKAKKEYKKITQLFIFWVLFYRPYSHLFYYQFSQDTLPNQILDY